MGQPVPKTMSLRHLTIGFTWAQICAANPQTVYSWDPVLRATAANRTDCRRSGGQNWPRPGTAAARRI
jgi:hypothetical protein